MCVNDIEAIRTIVKRCMKMHQYRSAIFWAEKAVHLSNDGTIDTLLLAEALFNSGQYHRTVAFLTSHETIREVTYARFLIAQCYFKCNEYLEALRALENLDAFQPSSSKQISISLIAFRDQDVKTDQPGFSDFEYLPEGTTASMLNSSMFLLKGTVNEALNNLPQAIYWYKEAFKLDSLCYEAFEKLLKLEAIDDKLLSRCEFPNLSSTFISAIKSLLLNKAAKLSDRIPTELVPFKNSTDLLVAQAERLLSVNHYRRCFGITSRILKNDPLNSDCLPVHVSVLKMLNKSNDLFMLANQLVKIFPTLAISWFAIGSYYLATRKHDLAKRHLRKATQQDRRFGPAWLALGHAYAADNEHDQAIAAYCTAAQIVRHSHLPMMYIGVEYSSSGNHSLAERFMQHALQRCPDDPTILHELGSLALSLNQYRKALKLLKQAYASVSQLSGQFLAPHWEPLFNNLGHTYRELGNYDEALKMHSTALSLVENSPTTLESMGLIYAQTGRYEEAIRSFQTALALHPSLGESSIATEMLHICMVEFAQELDPPHPASTSVPVKSVSIGRDIGEMPSAKELQSVDFLSSQVPIILLPGVPSIKDDLDIIQTETFPAPKGTYTAADDDERSMELD